MIFLAYLVIEVCFLGSLIAQFSSNKKSDSSSSSNKSDDQTTVALTTLYHVCKFSAHFGLTFLMLITAELFPTSMRCTGMGICFTLRMLGSLIASKTLVTCFLFLNVFCCFCCSSSRFQYFKYIYCLFFKLDHNTTMHRMLYCLLTLFFGSMSLFLPETKTFPLPRSILQIEAMQTTIGKKLRSRKVKMACERRQLELALHDSQQGDSGAHRAPTDRDRFSSNQFEFNSRFGSIPMSTNNASVNANANNSNNYNNNSSSNNYASNINVGDSRHPKVVVTSPSDAGSRPNDSLLSSSHMQAGGGALGANAKNSVYDTVTSVHDIEQDDHIYYGKDSMNPPSLTLERKLTRIAEVPSKNITRNNSMSDLN